MARRKVDKLLVVPSSKDKYKEYSDAFYNILCKQEKKAKGHFLVKKKKKQCLLLYKKYFYCSYLKVLRGSIIRH